VIRILLAAAALFAGSLRGQPIEVYSEFRRVGPFGKIVAADQGETPREILSPMLARNSYTCLHIAITPPRDQWFTLYVAQNPGDAVKVQIYKERFTRVGEHWIPDRVVPVTLPYQAKIPDIEPIEGQTAILFLLEIQVAPDAPVRRVRLEAQLNIGDDWIIYPMELRIMAPVVPSGIGEPSLRLAPAQRSDGIFHARLRQYVCGAPVPSGAALTPDTLSYFLDRAALQDVALARVRSIPVLKDWCDSKTPPANPEWTLRIRDHLLRGIE
jgi:hypothetical protein